MSGIQHNLIGFDRTVEKLHRGSRTFLCYAQNQGLFKEDRGCIARLGEISLELEKAENQYALPNDGKTKAEQLAKAGLSTLDRPSL